MRFVSMARQKIERFVPHGFARNDRIRTEKKQNTSVSTTE